MVFFWYFQDQHPSEGTKSFFGGFVVTTVSSSDGKGRINTTSSASRQARMDSAREPDRDYRVSMVRTVVRLNPSRFLRCRDGDMLESKEDAEPWLPATKAA